MTIEADITNALQTKIIAVAQASSISEIPLQMALRTFNAPQNQKWIEVIQIRNNPSNENWGVERTYAGVLRVLLHWPLDDAGVITPLQYLEEYAAAIPKGTIIRSGQAAVQITDNPDISSEIVDGTKIIIPLTLRYRNFR